MPNTSYYKDGVKVRFPTKNSSLRFQILPAYDSKHPEKLNGFVLSLLDRKLTAWLGMIQAARSVGHGERESQVSILSLDSFVGKEKCPYRRLIEYCNQSEDWRYLLGSKKSTNCILQPLKRKLLLNIVDFDEIDKGVQIGEFSYSIAEYLLNEEFGLVFQPNASLGDITNPINGPIFVAELPLDRKGKPTAGYNLRVDEKDGQIIRRSASNAELEARYHLDDPESFLRIPTGQEIVDALVGVLKGHKNKLGIDETCAIKEAVGQDYRVDTVTAPGAVNKIGWENPVTDPGDVGKQKMIAGKVEKGEKKMGEAGEDNWDVDEINFLESFEEYVEECGFAYDIVDLVRLHTSIKCFMCTLLAGEPGTGKSSLAELYMRALAGKENATEEPFKVFVNPAWMEPADLLGYENRHEDGGLNFVPAANGFAQFIRESKNKDEVRIACFEEINLACVEHYFSDFVQIISQRGGKISGCREREDGPDLQVSGDIRIIGTLNSDETTRALSPRFLNRCNGIELECQDEMVKRMIQDAVEGREPPAPKPFPWLRQQITNNDFHKWRESAEKRSANYKENYKKTVVSVLNILAGRKDGAESLLSAAGLSLAGRTVADLFLYVRNRPPYTDDAKSITEDERQLMALDEFLAQRLFFPVSPTPGTIDGIKELVEIIKRQGLNRSGNVLSKKVNEFKALTGML